jgi:hypothetical protein
VRKLLPADLQVAVTIAYVLGWRMQSEIQPRRDFREAWATACKKAGVPGRYRQDFRRTAVRNMERRGVPRSVANSEIDRQQ